MSTAGGSGKSEYELVVHEEMMDSIMKSVCDESRWDLRTELSKVGGAYMRQVAAWFENWRKGGRFEADEFEGDVVIGIRQLSDHFRRFGTFERKKDTYHCCLTLHLCTKLLACDRKPDPNWPSKDDRFDGIYKSNYQFRRDWVALLSHIVAYVEQMYLGETDTDFRWYLHGGRLARMKEDRRVFWWQGYAWAAIKGHIQTAQDKINKEPPPTAWQKMKMKKWVPGLGAGLEDGDDVGEMLARLRELSV
jgi:hypothetical protein